MKDDEDSLDQGLQGRLGHGGDAVEGLGLVLVLLEIISSSEYVNDVPENMDLC